MVNKTKLLQTSLVGVTILVTPALASASGTAIAGEGMLEVFTSTVTGNTGLLIGLGLSAYGLWQWLIDQASWGLMMLVGGVLVTAFPGIFNGFADFVGQATGLTLNSLS